MDAREKEDETRGWSQIWEKCIHLMFNKPSTHSSTRNAGDRLRIVGHNEPRGQGRKIRNTVGIVEVICPLEDTP